MRLEVLCTGDELLRGTVADTNTRDFAQLLWPTGVRVARSTAVPDDDAELLDAIRQVTARADVVILSGGLGPTDDDRTVAAVAQVAGVPLVLNVEALQRLEKRLRAAGREPGENNRRQAMVPDGARVLQSDVGTAPGLCMKVGRATVYVVPGVPREARWFVEKFAVPELRALRGGAVEKVTLRCAGLPESELDNRVRGLAERHRGLTVHFRTTFPENHLTLVASAETPERASALLAAARAEAAHALRDECFSDDDRTLPAVLRDLLVSRRETVATAESCTGGWLGKLLTDEPGSSRAYVGGIVAYENRVKEAQLGVPHDVLVQHGAVSQPVAEAMACAARERVGATWGLSTTGVAGPDGGSEAKPVGTVWIALAGPAGVQSRRLNLPWDRDRVRHAAAHHVLRWLWQAVRA